MNYCVYDAESANEKDWIIDNPFEPKLMSGQKLGMRFFKSALIGRGAIEKKRSISGLA